MCIVCVQSRMACHWLGRVLCAVAMALVVRTLTRWAPGLCLYMSAPLDDFRGSGGDAAADGSLSLLCPYDPHRKVSTCNKCVSLERYIW